MKVVGFCGYSGAGKTTLVEQLIPLLRADGLRISVVKHAHHAFDVDKPGKDSWRHRQAGAYEVLVASSRRLAKMREYEHEAEPVLADLLAELGACDWALVEGFRHAALPKIEVWRAAAGHPVVYPGDRHVVAVATDSAAQLPQPTGLPLLDLNRPADIAAYLLQNAARHEYCPD